MHLNKNIPNTFNENCNVKVYYPPLPSGFFFIVVNVLVKRGPDGAKGAFVIVGDGFLF